MKVDINHCRVLPLHFNFCRFLLCVPLSSNGNRKREQEGHQNETHREPGEKFITFSLCSLLLLRVQLEYDCVIESLHRREEKMCNSRIKLRTG